MAVSIRSATPYHGKVTIFKVPGGSFVAQKMEMSEREFMDALAVYLEGKSAKLSAEPVSNGDRKVKLRKPTPAAAAG